MSSAFELMWRQLRLQSQQIENNLEDTAGENITGVAFQFPVSTLADAPLAADGMTTYACRFISNGRKIGEGAGVGTGCPCYYNPITDSWFTFSSDVAVTT